MNNWWNDIKNWWFVSVDEKPMEKVKEKYRFATTSELVKIYGQPKENPDYLELITLPYPMVLSWDKKVKVTKIRCHKAVASDFKNIFQEILDHYGIDKIKSYGIDIFGGCFSFRKMRGGNDWSRHSWGIAIDLDPDNNGLRTTFNNARFSSEKYHPMFEIFEKYGFLNLGKEKNYDTMHFEKGILIK